MLRTFINICCVALLLVCLSACSKFAGSDLSENIPVNDSTPIVDKLAPSAGHRLLFNPQRRSDYADAVVLLEDLTQSQPTDSSLWLDLGYAYTTQNKFEQSRAALAKADQYSRSLSGTKLGWLAALNARVADNAEKEIQAWNALTKLDPKNRWVWYQLGSILYRTQYYDEASSAFENALLLDSRDQAWAATYIHYLNAKSYYRAGKLKESLQASLPGQRIKITERANFYRQAMAELALGSDKKVSEIIQKYRRLSNKGRSFDESIFQTNLANFFFELGDYDSAIDYARRAYELKPGQYQSWSLAYALVESGNASEAIALLQNAPQKLHTLAVKGWAYYRLGKFNQAQELLLAAKASQARIHYGVERDLAIVESALANPGTPQVPSVRWFGD